MNEHPAPLSLSCPQCGKRVSCAATERPDSFPFCQKRCRILDLGAWSDGAHCIDGEDMDADGSWTDGY